MIVLASSSPRRKQILSLLGIPYEIDPANVDERPRPNEEAEAFATRLAREKALNVARRRPKDYVVAGDTVVVLDGQIMGKPESPAAAEQMLASLSGKEHRVITAVALANGEQLFERHDITRVRMRSLDADVIRAYVATGEPLDKAGSYGLQGRGAVLVERIEGDYFTVIGLSLRLLYDLLEAAGVPYRFTL